MTQAQRNLLIKLVAAVRLKQSPNKNEAKNAHASAVKLLKKIATSGLSTRDIEEHLRENGYTLDLEPIAGHEPPASHASYDEPSVEEDEEEEDEEDPPAYQRFGLWVQPTSHRLPERWQQTIAAKVAEASGAYFTRDKDRWVLVGQDQAIVTAAETSVLMAITEIETKMSPAMALNGLAPFLQQMGPVVGYIKQVFVSAVMVGYELRESISEADVAASNRKRAALGARARWTAKRPQT